MMPVVSTQQIIGRAFAERYGVAAFNVVNDLTMEAILAAGEELRAPVIVQTSMKTVTSVGADVLFAMWRAMADRISVPVSLQLDHCPDRDVISRCLATGWNSVLFDGSALSIEDNTRQTAEVVHEARAYGALVEGEIEAFKRTEDLNGDEGAHVETLETVVDFVRATSLDVFAPAIGNAHGLYKATPTLNFQRVTDVVNATGLPVALHGGTGMTQEQFGDLVARGCAKVNVSTAVKVSLIQSGFDYVTRHPEEFNPPRLFAAQRTAVMEMAKGYIQMFGSEGKAW